MATHTPGVVINNMELLLFGLREIIKGHISTGIMAHRHPQYQGQPNGTLPNSSG